MSIWAGMVVKKKDFRRKRDVYTDWRDEDQGDSFSRSTHSISVQAGKGS
jgi:hypothetical protein